MSQEVEERELTRAEKILAAAMVGLLFLGTVEALHLAEVRALRGMTAEERWVWSRVLYYGVSFSIALAAILLAPRLRGFARTFGSVALGYGLLMLIWSVGKFILDCLPEVAAAFAGAAAAGGGLWYLRRSYYTPERVAYSRYMKGVCPFCGKGRIGEHRYCPMCGASVRVECRTCGALVGVLDAYCPACGSPLRE
ncbi:MAG: hypothetical protein DRN96_06660 [Thermoproteota archaeon]|nr:MAG: hypothetical protein DRN96_06660 [Candidatus Korarchaeota archaeon]